MRSRKTDERSALRERFWPDAKAWTGENSMGWFRAPRTLPLLCTLLKSKKLRGHHDLASVYVTLWARHLDSGVVEIVSEKEMAYESGYTSGRALRTWQERMALLENLGFIKSQPIANQKYRYVLMVDPASAVAALHKRGLIDESWLATYDARRIATKEAAAPAKASIILMPIAEKAK
jgi:hypothetical protein